MKIAFDALFMPGVGGGDGQCDDIPYAKKIPAKATTRSWEVSEDNGMVYVWFDRDQKPADPDGQKFNLR